MALVLLAVLAFETPAGPRSGGWRRVAGIILLLMLAASEVRHGVLAKATGRAAEDHFPLALFSLAILTGVVYRGFQRTRLNGLTFLLVVPVMIGFAYSLGWQFNPLAMTTARAQKIDNAIGRYNQATGVYPNQLADLSPRYLLWVPPPLTGRGQVWCYQSGSDYYRLGYVFYQRYYRPTYPTPFTEIRVSGARGELPSGPWMCDLELEKHKSTLGL